MLNESLWRLKVHAYLHDPPEKALILFEGGHAERGRELAARLAGDPPPGTDDAIMQADRLASGADRETFLQGVDPLSWGSRPVLRHPLSGDAIDLSQWGWIGIEPAAAKMEVDRALERLKDRLAADGDLRPERAFWGLWRLLPEYLIEAKSGHPKIGALWEYLPAETRMPDHSIWDHQRLASALAPILWRGQDPALLLLTFGPVQGFIGTARRTADLWAGSFILSWLTSRAVLPVVQSFGPDAVLFPVLWRQPLMDEWLRTGPLRLPLPRGTSAGSVASLPNRFLAVVPEPEAKGVATDCLSGLRQSWQEMGLEACERFIRSAGELSGADRESITGIFRRQLPSHLEAHWAAFPWPADAARCQDLLKARLGSNAVPSLEPIAMEGVRQYRPGAGALYGPSYRAVDLTLGASKAVRVFESEAERGLKCSLCGDREVVHPYTDPPIGQCRAWWRELSGRRPAVARAGEALCAVCLVKRLAPGADDPEGEGRLRVPSTSEIAAAPFKLTILERLGEHRAEAAALVRATRENNALDCWSLPKVWNAARAAHSDDAEIAGDFARIDGECFLAGAESENEADATRVSPEMARAAHALVEKAARAPSAIPAPSPYLALLRMDGDSMGEWFAGERTVEIAKTIHPDTADWLRQRLGPEHRFWSEKRRLTPAIHAAISGACGAFALRAAPALADGRLAHLIYAGGDDLLTLVSLEDALDLARELRLAFGGHMEVENGKEVAGFDKGLGFYRVRDEVFQSFGRSAGLSAGLVVFHHKHPLQAAVEESRRVEKWAKELVGKDVLALAIIRRGGQQTGCRLRWTSASGGVDAVRDLIDVSGLVKKHVLSPRFLSSLTALLDHRDAKLLPDEGIDLLVRREVGRHWDKDRGETLKLSKDDACERVWRLKRQTPDTGEWLGALEAAVFLARGGR